MIVLSMWLSRCFVELEGQELHAVFTDVFLAMILRVTPGTIVLV